jgi:two-component system cell cycle sensor histidine kinase/response regulator CckA
MTPPPGAPTLDPELLRTMIEDASDPFFITDLELRIQWTNTRALEVLGRDPGEVIGRTVPDFFDRGHPLNAEPIRRRELMAGERVLTRRAFRRPDGGIRVLEVAAKRIGEGRLVGIARDITEVLAQHERAAGAEGSFRTLIEATPDGIVVHRERVIVYANAALARMLGWPGPEALLGTPVIEIVHIDDRDAVAARIDALGRGLPATPFTEMRVLRADGSSLVCSVGGVRVHFEGARSILAVLRDVTPEKTLQAHLAKMDRMASLGGLAAGVAHEINNPLAYVMLHLEAITSVSRRASEAAAAAPGAGLADRAPSALSVIADHAASASEGAERVRTIVRDLRVFSRVEEQEIMRSVDVIGALELALSTASHEIKHRARIVRELSDVPPVAAPEGRLTQVFLNLVLNAAQAIPEGDPTAHTITIRAARRGAHVHVAISDDGAGIPAEVLPRLFEPFFTTKPTGIGSGLGLAICHGIATSVGGRIDVESEVGKGSTFTVVLPVGIETPVRQAATVLATPRATRRLRLLIVDDEPAILKALRLSLRANHEVELADSAEAAREILAADPGFDAILCDVLMPGLGGAGLHAWVSAELPRLEPRMLFMSGGRIGAAADALAERVQDRWIDKPFAIAELVARIAEIAGAREPL